MIRFRCCTLFAALLLFSSCNENPEENAIRQKAEEYQKAFNERKPQALAELWAEDADYINPLSGETLSGRDAIEKGFEKNFKNPDAPTMAFKVDSITFPKADQALETGTATLTWKNQPPTHLAYKATYEKVQGNWLIAEIKEIEEIQAPTNYEHLKELDWLVGTWIDQDEDSTITSEYKWDRNKNFLIQKFSVAVEDKFQLEGNQIIGYDPIRKKIRSWVFDSDGGFGEGKWSKKGASWVVETSQTLSDGKNASSTNIFTPINANSYSWEAVDREIDGELLPNIDPVTIVRKGTSP